MILEDLVSDDPHGLESRYLLDDWVAELAELCVTDQVFHETNDCPDERRRLSLRRYAAQCRHIARGAGDTSDLLARIAELAPSAGAAVDTELLAKPLSLEDLRAIYREAGRDFYAPQAPIAVDESIFGRLYTRSSVYAE